MYPGTRVVVDFRRQAVDPEARVRLARRPQDEEAPLNSLEGLPDIEPSAWIQTRDGAFVFAKLEVAHELDLERAGADLDVDVVTVVLGTDRRRGLQRAAVLSPLGRTAALLVARRLGCQGDERDAGEDEDDDSESRHGVSPLRRSGRWLELLYLLQRVGRLKSSWHPCPLDHFLLRLPRS